MNYQKLSLPAWECGLKSVQPLGVIHLGQSLPAWECGLKYVKHLKVGVIWSHSLRGSVD